MSDYKKWYEKCKEEARQEAIEWQTLYFSEDAPDLSYGELADYYAYFEALGRRFGLLEEFKENGII